MLENAGGWTKLESWSHRTAERERQRQREKETERGKERLYTKYYLTKSKIYTMYMTEAMCMSSEVRGKF